MNEAGLPKPEYSTEGMFTVKCDVSDKEFQEIKEAIADLQKKGIDYQKNDSHFIGHGEEV